MRRFVSAVLAAVALSVLPAVPAQAATGNQPILFVHGYDSNASTWNEMVAAFGEVGYADGELFTASYNTNQSNVITAGQVRAKVDQIRRQTGWASIDIITHSMGSLSSRHYLKNLGGQDAVESWVSLAGTNHGTRIARFCFSQSCREMRLASPFLTDLNAGDETPGVVRYGTWWSPCDLVVDPNSSVILDGATNTKTACIGHGDLLTDRTVFTQVHAFVGP